MGPDRALSWPPDRPYRLCLLDQLFAEPQGGVPVDAAGRRLVVAPDLDHDAVLHERGTHVGLAVRRPLLDAVFHATSPLCEIRPHHRPRAREGGNSNRSIYGT